MASMAVGDLTLESLTPSVMGMHLYYCRTNCIARREEEVLREG